MENNNLEYSRRPLPLELLVEMHKCLPLADAINVLVNVPSFAFVDINKPRMLRTIRQLKTSLNEYIGALVSGKYAGDDLKELVIRNKNGIEWQPQFDALLRYGSWMTSTRKLVIDSVGVVPENFVEKLLLHLANSSSTQMMLQFANIKFHRWTTGPPLPTFLEPLFNEKQFQIGTRCCLFESVQLETDDGQILCIHEGELVTYRYGKHSKYELRLLTMNKMNGNEWFEITMFFDSSKQFIRQLKFTQWKMQSLKDVEKFIHEYENPFEEKDGGKTLVAKKCISSSHNLDLFLRRGARFTQFRHLKINQYYSLWFCCPQDDYVDYLINFVSNAKHPEEFLESIDFKLQIKCSYSIKNLWEICQKEIPKGGKFVHFGEKKLNILSAKTMKSKKTCSKSKYLADQKLFAENSLEFTLANLPTNGEYLFDFCVEFGNLGFNEYVAEYVGRIKIQKRKLPTLLN